MQETAILVFIFFVVAFYVILNQLKGLAKQPTAITKIVKKDNHFSLLQLHINKDRKFLKIERWVEVARFEGYEAAKNLQRIVEQTWKNNES